MTPAILWLIAQIGDFGQPPPDPGPMAPRTEARFVVHVRLEGGVPFPISPTVLSNCRYELFGNGNLVFSPGEAQHCVARIMLPGYWTTITQLRDGATVVLKRLGIGEGSAVSITTLSAPPAARKLWEKGTKLAAKKRWADAAAAFQKALVIYPEYATAWSDLSDAHRELGRRDEAREAAEKASALDPMYIRPHVQLARLAADESNWQKALVYAERALALKPIDFPAAYFYHAVASYGLGRYDAAARSAVTALELGGEAGFPKLPLVLQMAVEAQNKMASGRK